MLFKNKNLKKFTAASTSICMIGASSIFTACAASADTWKNNVGSINLDTMEVSGLGIAADGTTVKITEGGDYTVTGTLADGMIYVNCDDKVKLRLSGASITNADGPCIYFEQSQKGFITITEGTQNTLTDGTEYTDSDAKGAIFSNDDIEIKGSGSLTVTSNYNHAIVSDDKIDIQNGNLTLTAAKDGLHANDDITVSGGTIEIKSADDGLQSEDTVNIDGGTFNITADGKAITGNGNVTVNSGTINILKATEGIESKAELTINDGDINITCSDDGLNTGNQKQNNEQTDTANPDGQNPPQPPQDGTQPDITQLPQMPQNGEQIQPPQNGDNAAPPQMPQDGTQTQPPQNNIKGNKNMQNKNEMRPPRTNGGNNNMQTPPNQNQNSAQTPQNGEQTQPPRENGEFGGKKAPNSKNGTDDGTHLITINGGNIYINADGDSIDSNGDLVINGGNITIDGTVSNGDGILDSDGEITINGGTLLGIGSSGMFETPSDTSKQNTICVFFDTQKESSVITVKNSSGKTIAEHTAKKSYSAIIYSNSDIEKGESYSVYIDGTLVQTVKSDNVVTSAGSKQNTRANMQFKMR